LRFITEPAESPGGDPRMTRRLLSHTLIGSLGLAAALAFSGRPCLAAADDDRDAENRGLKESDKPWGFRRPVLTPDPTVKNKFWPRNFIDAYILAGLEEHKLSPAPEADRVTLIRRLTYDLTGLPPTPEEIDAFVNDDAVDAYEKVVDRLLASPRFGERWAMFWLDLVRYAETDGFKADDLRPTAWRYRDYVIRSFNDDKPYDRFVKEQLAGDELWPDESDARIAGGLNRHVGYEYNAVNLEQRRQETLNDITDTNAAVFLGLTLGCARCHDHKFDPISQKDYYRFQAFFAGYQPDDGVKVGSREELAEHARRQGEWEAATAEVRSRMESLEGPVRRKESSRRKGRFSKDLQAIYDKPAEQRTPFEQQIAYLIHLQVDVERTEVVKKMSAEVKKQWQDLDRQMQQMELRRPQDLPTAMTATDVGPQAPPTHLLRRGEWRLKGEVIPPGYPTILDERPAVVRPPASGKTTGRRTALAEWLTGPADTLTARVMVNRLWQGHFGRGIVGTPSDFGAQGEAPSHAELLDRLAIEFVKRGWSLKAMHRLMVLSSTYRQSTRFDARASAVDEENRLLWRMSRRRLEGEAMRDAMLAVAGRLNLQAGGPSVMPELPADLGTVGGWKPTADAAGRDRRSVYVFAKRNLKYPLFQVFDSPDANEMCSRRNVCTNAPQALTLLNNAIVIGFARSFAERVLAETGGAPDRFVERAVRLALGRTPSTQERTAMVEFLHRQAALLKADGSVGKGGVPGVEPAFAAAAADLCHVLVNLNEFVYVD
jgi:hypothetical protein